MPWSGIASGVLSSVAGLAGGLLNNSSRSSANLLSYEQNKRLQERDQAFQREVYQNQYQWKASDAKKAGLHPLSIIGGGAYSASPSSSPSQVLPDDYSFLGKLGDNIGDAFTAYKTKDQAKKEADWLDEQKNMQRTEHEYRLANIASDTAKNNGLALEATRRAWSYTTPWASGNEVIKGQVDANVPHKFERYRNPDGTLSGRYPTEQYQGIHDDKPIIEYKPGAEALYWDARDFLADKFGLWNFRGARYGY